MTPSVHPGPWSEEALPIMKPGSKTELCQLAAKGLIPMLDRKSQWFCDIYEHTENGMVQIGLSPRYTMMTLLGLRRYEVAGNTSPVAIAPILNALVADTGWINNAGDLGLLLWTCAELCPERVPEIFLRTNANEALLRFADGRQGRTMEVAWYLTGLATCVLAGHADLPEIKAKAAEARAVLANNCGPAGVYGHFARSGSFGRYLRGRIGSFADQVYPTIALARFYRAWHDEAAREAALKTAQIMCDLQGPTGEWSWQYDSVNGRVVSRYPVYSVHQHAMAPMMLLETEEASGRDFTPWIEKGLAWISGNNELGRDFVEPTLNLVWRCIYLEPKSAYADAALRFSRMRSGSVHPGKLAVRYECRPYELGWLLYAFSGK